MLKENASFVTPHAKLVLPPPMQNAEDANLVI